MDLLQEEVVLFLEPPDHKCETNDVEYYYNYRKCKVDKNAENNG
jgi:hypothetical protein